MADLQERFWGNLLEYIQERTVVPIIGPELVTVREGESDVTLYSWLAQRLAADLGLPMSELGDGFDLNQVVALHLRRRGRRVDLYSRIHSMLRNAALAPPDSLRALAAIPGFDLFVSLTFDSLLADAIRAASTDDEQSPQQIAYSPYRVCDLTGPKVKLQQPVVFHLLGRASASPDYAICDDDAVEFLLSMQEKPRQPKTLFKELRGNSLLILGCDFGDCFWRFFLRTARGLELPRQRGRFDVLVGDQIARDAKLGLFLEGFSSNTPVVPLSAAQFVTQLAQRWQAAHSAAAQRAEYVAGETGPDGGSIPTGAVFVSYARPDLEAASRLAEGLRAAGLEVWFDKAALQMGDDWVYRIRRLIARCSLFLPVISRQAVSEENRRAYFWREWNDADDFSRGVSPNERFIVPVVIDGTRIDHAILPDSFKRAQGITLPEGMVTPEVAKLLRSLVRDFHRRQRDDAQGPPRREVGPRPATAGGATAATAALPDETSRSTPGEGNPQTAGVQRDQPLAAQFLASLPPSYSGSDNYVFMSYKREDLPRLAGVMHRLVEWGYNVWYDKGIPGGAEWDSIIETRLKGCTLLILFITKAAINSKNVRMEVRYATSLDKPVIAVRLEEAELMHGMAMLLGGYQMIDGAAGDYLEELRRAIAFHQEAEAARRRIAP